MNFEDKLNNAFDPPDSDHIKEGTILPIDKIVSNAIGIPSGDYIVAAVTANSCKLISTNEADSDTPFEVHRPTLAGFFNPEVHTKVVNQGNGSLIEDLSGAGLYDDDQLVSGVKDKYANSGFIIDQLEWWVGDIIDKVKIGDEGTPDEPYTYSNAAAALEEVANMMRAADAQLTGQI